MKDVWRVVKVLLAYGVGASLLVAALPAIRRTFLLPQLFDPLARWTLAAGAVFAALVAWRYPRMGLREDGGEEARGE